MAHDKTLEVLKQILDKSPKRNFDESIDLAINLRNLDMSQPQNRIDEEIVLPFGLGKPVKIAIFAKGETAQKAKAAGVDQVIEPETIAALGEDKMKTKELADVYNVFISEAAYMPAIGKSLGQVLGPRGKMPIPLTPDKDVTQIIARLRNSIKVRSKDKLTFHIPIGRRNMNPEQIAENVETVISRLEHKLEKGTQNIRSIYVKTTMGPAVKVI